MNNRLKQVFGVVCLGLLLGCAADGGREGGANPDGSGSDHGAGGEDSDDGVCVPQSCAALGAQCGVIEDGCGGFAECGGCDDGLTCGGTGMSFQCGEGSCVPLSCDEVGAQCGPVADGCGGVIECGGCAGPGESCVDGSCVVLSCGDAPENACGGCVDLALAPGDSCGCGSPALCDGDGHLICDDGTGRYDELVLPQTSDAVDGWGQAEGTIELLPGGYRDVDSYEVHVDDTFYGLLQPEFEYQHPGGFEARVCVSFVHDTWGRAYTVHCEDESIDLGSSSCCKVVGPEQSGVRFGVNWNVDIPTPTNEDGTWEISVSSYATGEVAPDFCAGYSLRYSF